MPHITIVRTFDWHRPMLDPLAAPLGRIADVETTTAAAFLEHGAERSTDIVVVADAGIVARLRSVADRPLYVHVGHGLISKRQTEYYYRDADFICLAGRETERRLTERGHLPRRGFWVTGLVQADPLFREGEGGVIRRVAGVRRSVLYAPTWNATLSSAEMLGTQLVESIRGADSSIGIIIKPHPHIPVAHPHLIERWRRLAEDNPGVELAESGDDLVPFLKGADLMVSDASSAIFHYLALNRPIVLIDNPARFTDPGVFDPEGIEWTWRDMADRVDAAHGLAGVVRAALDRPDRLAARRLHYRQTLYGDHADGRAVERIVAHIGALLEGRAAA